MRIYPYILLITMFIVTGCVTYEDGEPVKDDAYEERQQEDKKEKQDKDKGKEKTEEKQEKNEKPKNQTIKVEEEIELNSVSAEIQTISVEDNKVTVPIWWSHWTNYDKAHLSLLLIPTVYQGDKSLEMTDGEDTLLKQKEKGVDDRAVLEFELIDNKTPLDIKFIETTDEAKEKNIKVKIEKGKSKKNKKSKDKKSKTKDEQSIEEIVLDEHSSIEKATLEDGYLKIELDADGSFSVNTMFSHPANEALEAMNTAFKDDKVDTVGAIVKGTIIDAKGNESKEDVISIYYDRDNFEEFDFENFKKMSLAEPWRIYNESDSYYIHPAIYKDIKEKNTSNLVNGSSKVE